MSKKKLAGKKQKNAATDRTIQYVAGGVVLLVLGFFIWQFIPKQGAVEQTALICEKFAGIPAADQYESAPPMMVDAGAKYFATFEMETGGTFKAQLYPDKAPITVNSFIFLTCKGFYEGVTFHRVLEGFMAQGGDPTGTGMGGPGYQFVSEISDLTFDKAGVMAMANSGPDTNGSQFFITFDAQDFLNGGYTIFGQVVEGMDVVNAITLRDPDQAPAFEGDKINSILISEE